MSDTRPNATPQTQTAPVGQTKAAGEKPDAEKSRYRSTLNLPQTPFPMKANLVQNEPASIKRWDKAGLYAKLRQTRAGAPRFVFHDGPPYANGGIHLGHLMNKCLKDFVVRTKTLAGFDCPYVPGWDCHGLPIEHKVVTELMEAGKFDKLNTLTESHRRMAIRRECQKSAEKWVKHQAGEMTRLLTLADYPHPYLTMSPEYEGATLEVLANLLEQGLVYRALKPVHWSIANETALAEAELEYYDREDISVYVDFEATDADAVYDAFGLPPRDRPVMEVDVTEVDVTEGDVAGVDGGDEAGIEPVAESPKLPDQGVRPDIRPSFMIWTTTPWTLPANLAIAINEKFEYALVFVDGNVTVMAKDAVERVTKAAKAQDLVVLATAPGSRLVGLRYRHPFVDPAKGDGAPDAAASRAVFTVVAAEYVTLEDGTGLVHTAPGHGTEDYQTGHRVGLPIYCPVRANGSYDDTVPPWLKGLNIWKANDAVVKHLRDSGHLFYDHKFTHSYPHDWRGKTPVIFRCTEQWFIGVDRPRVSDARSLRQASVAQTEHDLKFVPEWGRNRMRGMLESRPDWCISRQRSWGLPIPAFFLPDGSVSMTAASTRAVAKLVREKGSDIWFTSEAAELLKYYDPAGDPDAPAPIRDRVLAPAALKKGPDILDVWFESGSSWNAVMRERALAYNPQTDGNPAFTDLYLEGSDQHRGWFQSSLLLSLGAAGRPPFAEVLTHGFMVDKDGKKMSKSLGNTLDVAVLLKDLGADVCRWWVASLAYENDIKVDRSYFDLAGESYRKIRNTLRFMLSNLFDFEAAAPDKACECGRACVPLSDFRPTDLDSWVLAEYDRLAADVTAAYSRYDFRDAQARLYEFCNSTLSATYLAAIKDRLYCDKPDSPRRRRTQTALWNLTDGLCRLLAPILVHTADEAYRSLWKAAPDDTERCVHTTQFLRSLGVPADERWATVMQVREQTQRAIEKAKSPVSEGGLGVDNPLDTGVVLSGSEGALGGFDPVDLADLLGVSQVLLEPGEKAPRVIDLRNQPRCERSWKRDGTVLLRSDGGLLSARDALAVGLT